MKSLRPFVLNFYVPLLISASLFLLILVSPKFVTTGSYIELDSHVILLGLKIPLPLWLEKVWLIRTVLIIAAFISLAKALTLDFSKYFPAIMHMDVYFDERGIERSLNVLSSEERSEVPIATDWRQYITAYDEAVLLSLEKLWRQELRRRIPDTADFSRNFLHARGTATFMVKRVGLLCYRITESSGRLVYELDVPKKTRRCFCGLFELHETFNNHLRPRFLKLIRSRSIILMPEFKQIFSIETSAQSAPFDHIVIGLTKVILFPFPHFGNTIYLWKHSSGAGVPIAYGVYIHDALI